MSPRQLIRRVWKDETIALVAVLVAMLALAYEPSRDLLGSGLVLLGKGWSAYQ
jgi:hypothetical protein